jgi:uncharacterized membrane protein YdjX (TVP38/TMEM64 family)
VSAPSSAVPAAQPVSVFCQRVMHDQVDSTVSVSPDVPVVSGASDASDASDDAAEVRAARGSRSRLGILVAIIAVAWVGTMIGTALSPTLVVESPLALIALNPNWRHVVLAVPVTGAVPFFAVTMGRMFLTDPVFYYLGRWYGNDAVVWVEGRAGGVGRVLRWVERKFKKSGRLLLFLMPGGFICLLAGASGMSRRTFLLIDIAGTVMGAVVLRVAGDAFAGPIDTVRAFVAEHMGVLTLCTIAFVAVGVTIRGVIARRNRSA